MKRLFWLGVGLAVGGLVVRAVSRKAQAYSPRGIAVAARNSGRNLVDSVRGFVDDVRDGMHEREQELRTALAAGVPLHELDEADLEADAEAAADDFDEVFGDAHDRPEDKEATR